MLTQSVFHQRSQFNLCEPAVSLYPKLKASQTQHRTQGFCAANCHQYPYCLISYPHLTPSISSHSLPPVLFPPIISVLSSSCHVSSCVCGHILRSVNGLHPLLLIAVVVQADLTPPTVPIIPLIPHHPPPPAFSHVGSGILSA